MRTEAVILNYAAPMGVDHFLSAFLRTDTVSPVIFVCETAARPAQHGNLHFFKRLYNVVSHTVCVGNVGIFSHINTFINTSSQMFRKMSLNFRIDVAFLIFGIDK